MTSKAYRKIVADLKRKQGASVGGFRAALRELAKAAAENDLNNTDWDNEEPLIISLDDATGDFYGEWFGDVRVVTAAYRIDKNPEVYAGADIHVWEVETSQYDRLHKLQAYGRIADGDGPRIWLHVIDKYGREDCVFDNGMLEAFAFADIYPDEYIDEHEKQCRKLGRPKPPKTLAVQAKRSEERAILEAVYELGLIKPGELA